MIDFRPVKSWQAHIGSINGMCIANNHVITIGDDSIVLLTNINNQDPVKKLDINQYCLSRQLYKNRFKINRKLKSIHLFPTVQIFDSPMASLNNSPEKGGHSHRNINNLFETSTISLSVSDGDVLGGTKNNLGSYNSPQKAIYRNGCIAVGTSCGEVILINNGVYI